MPPTRCTLSSPPRPSKRRKSDPEVEDELEEDEASEIKHNSQHVSDFEEHEHGDEDLPSDYDELPSANDEFPCDDDDLPSDDDDGPSATDSAHPRSGRVEFTMVPASNNDRNLLGDMLQRYLEEHPFQHRINGDFKAVMPDRVTMQAFLDVEG